MASAIEAPATTQAEGQTSHTPEQAEALAKLRVPFPQEQINPLPKIICGECSRSRTKVCENPRHAKSKCKTCDNYITQAHMHLDYVGHAELTNRLLDADPWWTWEPVAFDNNGLPAFDSNGGLWIRLTVCGHTRLGYGDSQGKSGPNAVKEAIGDALRNAAMRFGAALDLWAKSDLREAQNEHPKTAEDDGRSSSSEQGRQARPHPQESTTGRPASKQEDPLPGLMARYQNPEAWNDAARLMQVRVDGKQAGVSERQVQMPPAMGGQWTTFDDLLETRINQLTAAQGGTTERSVA